MGRGKSIFSKVLWVLVIGTLIWIFIFGDDIKRAQKPPFNSVVEQVMEGTKGKYGIVVKNLQTEDSYKAWDSQSFEAGSLYKLWVMAAIFQQVQEGKLTEEDILSEDISRLNKNFSIDPKEAELTEGIITLTVRDALSQMITISHNYAALLLTQKIKLSTVAAFLEANGFTNSKVGIDGNPPVTTPSDIALFYEKLYEGTLAGPEYTQKMIELLKSQKLNDGLPKHLPPEVRVAHKTGDIGWFKHDAGIVYMPNQEISAKENKKVKGDYIIVVLSESNSPLGAQERIAALSKAVFDYFYN